VPKARRVTGEEKSHPPRSERSERAGEADKLLCLRRDLNAGACSELQMAASYASRCPVPILIH
jgi:hypothetical protein